MRYGIGVRIALGAMLLTVAALPVMAAEKKTPPPTAATPSAVQSRIDNLDRLVNTSSGAQRVIASGNRRAIALKEEAGEELRQGITLFRDGRYKEANQVLGAATRKMFDAIRMAGSGQSAERKRLGDFQARIDSVDALLSALKRIGVEKGVERKIDAVIAKARTQIGQAQELVTAGRADQGRQLLDAAYESAKGEIERLRSGDTLVRTLNFKNKEEEYHYELDRNSTHQMLVKVLLEEKMKMPSVKQRVDQFLKQAGDLRAKAESEAASGAFDRAVRTLENATRELVRAIRSAGVYIPG